MNQLAVKVTMAAGSVSYFDVMGGLGQGNRRIDRAGLTVVRCIFNVTSGPSAAGDAEWYSSLFVADEDALASGNLPEPGFDQANYYYNEGGFHSRDLDAGAVSLRIERDIRTARRLRSPMQTLVHIMHNSGSVNLDYFASFRTLVKLP